MTHTFGQWLYTSIFAGLASYLIVSCSAGMVFHAYTPGRRLVESMLSLAGAGLFYGAMFTHGLFAAHQARLDLGTFNFVFESGHYSQTGIFHLYAYVAFVPPLLAGFGVFLGAHANKTGFLPKHMAASSHPTSQT